MYVRSIMMLVLALTAATLATAQDTLPPGESTPAQPKLSPQQFSQMVSYALGRSVAEDCEMGGVELDLRALQTGINEVQSDKDPQWKEQQLNQVMHMFAMRIQQHIAAENKQRGEAFLAENAKKQAVQATPSGLQYKVLAEGDGATPTEDSVVVCHYRGTFTNGQVFDSSYDRGQPAQFPVQGVIPGWTEALKMMQVGDKYQLFVPSDLAYGAAGREGIGPNETLIFEVELLQVGQRQPQQQ
jgi:FKBP-type peptidyl-prolyl cis-trans isomerase FklB